MFLREVVGTDGHFTVDEISDQLRNIIVARFGTIVAGSGIPVLDLAANYDQLGQFVHGPDRARVRQLRPRADHDPGRERLAAARGRAGARPAHLDGRGRRSVRSTPSSRRPRRCAPPPATRARPAQAIGMMVGMGVGQQASPWGARPAEPPRRRRPRRRCRSGRPTTSRSDGKPTGPFARRAAAGAGRRAAADRGVAWSGRQGMAGWQAAGEVAELGAAVRGGAAARARRRLSPCRAAPGAGSGPSEDERAQGGVKVSSPQLRQFACEQCGAVLSYAPGTAELVCSYCGHRNRIVEAPVEIVEQPLDPALRAAGGEAAAERARTRQMRRLRCRLQLRAAELRRALPVLRPAGGGRPRPLPQDPPDRRCCRS